MADKPEFIGLMRDIRDRLYTGMVTMYNEVVSKYDTVVTLAQELGNVTVIKPVTVVPVQENGDLGLPDVEYNSSTGEFTFSIPAGSKGDSLAIKYTVALTADLYAIATVEAGEIAFSNESSLMYVKLDTGTNTGASDWSTGTTLTPTTQFTGLTDTPIAYTGFGGYAVVVNANEDATVFYDLPTNLATKANLSGATFTGAVKGVAPSADEDFCRKDYVDGKASLTGATFTGLVKGITPTVDADFVIKSYADTKVAKVTGWDLSQNDLTDELKAQYDALASNAILAHGSILGSNGTIERHSGIASCVRESLGTYLVTLSSAISTTATVLTNAEDLYNVSGTYDIVDSTHIRLKFGFEDGENTKNDPTRFSLMVI